MGRRADWKSDDAWTLCDKNATWGRQRQRRTMPKHKHAVLEALPKLEAGGCRLNHDRVSIRKLISFCKPCSWDGHWTEGITHVGTKVLEVGAHCGSSSGSGNP